MDYRDYIIAISAIFLALALGILVGVTFGEDFLVSNQREIIEMMENERQLLRSQLEEKEELLDRWQQLESLVWQGFAARLEGCRPVVVAAQEQDLYLMIKEIFNRAGASAGGIIFQTAQEDIAVSLMQTLREDGDLLTQAAASGFDLIDMPHKPQAPLTCVLVVHKEYWSEKGATWLEAAEAAGVPLIVAVPGELALPSPPEIIQQVDTFWGKLSLLEALLEEKPEAGGWQ